MNWIVLALALAMASPAACWTASSAASSGGPASEFRLQTDRPERGHYRLWASETIEVRGETLLEILAQSRCKEGCDAVAEHVAVDETLERLQTPNGERNVSWTFIDSLIDASYFHLTEVVREPGRIVRRFGTAPPDVVEEWQSPQRQHDPHFHQQGGTWTLTEEFDAAGQFLHTRVQVEMEMRSDRFLVNLAPGRVLSGAGDHLETIFGQMRDLEGPRLGPAR